MISFSHKVSRLASVRSSYGNNNSADEKKLTERAFKSAMSYQTSDLNMESSGINSKQNSNQDQQLTEEFNHSNMLQRVIIILKLSSLIINSVNFG